ncbi:MAG: phosphoribosylformylglycinamidine synthase subunit PurQ [Phycisphaerae bacterium]|nr:phosphoribosylformylglycinamidine synthase subunit PurQ [Phycisphaerae bacterium]
MAGERILIVRAPGTNCDREAAFAWETVGCRPERVHIAALAERPAMLHEYALLTLPGGFSYGDDVAAGRIMAAHLERALADELPRFIAAGKLVFGICNGFQVLAKMGLLPFHAAAPAPAGAVAEGRQSCTVTFNEPAGFQDRWITLSAGANTPCLFVEPGRSYEMPIAHGEGRVLFASEALRRAVADQRLAALRYVDGAADMRAEGPANPNGSTDAIAGLCDATGRVFGLMPHPERHLAATQHPCWTSRGRRADAPGDGLAIFQRAAAALR